MHSGHYVSLVRGEAPNATNQDERPRSSSSDDESDPWMLFDDLAKERVSFVDPRKTLKVECPYLLFYQVQPIESESTGLPPTYLEATSRTSSDRFDPPEKTVLPDYSDNDIALTESLSPTSEEAVLTTDSTDWASSTRTSMDANAMLDDSRGRASMSSYRGGSTTRDDGSVTGSIRIDQANSVPTTPFDDSRGGFLSLAPRRGSRQGTTKKPRSRPGSQGADSANKFMLNMSKLTNRMSRTDVPAPDVAGPSSAGPNHTVETNGKVEMNGIIYDSTVIPLKMNDGSEEAERVRARKEKKSKGKHHHSHVTLKKKGDVPDRDCIVM